MALYAWGDGYDVALLDLVKVEDYLWPYTKPRRLTVTSPPLDPFPVRTTVMSGRERGDGWLMHEWRAVLPLAAWQAILTDKFAGGTLASVAQTVYTRSLGLTTFIRGNCDLVLPSPKNGTFEDLKGRGVRVIFKLNNFTAL
jgi:hypothetical protein